MAFSSSVLAAEPRAISLGPVKMEVHDIGAASGDTSGTVTAASLTRVTSVMGVTGPLAATAVAISGNAVTLTFDDPLATVTGQITLLGI